MRQYCLTHLYSVHLHVLHVDKSTALILAEIAQIDVDEFAQKMFEAGSNFANKTEEEILNQDFKIFHSGDYTFGVSQISALSRNRAR